MALSCNVLAEGGTFRAIGLSKMSVEFEDNIKEQTGLFSGEHNTVFAYSRLTTIFQSARSTLYLGTSLM